MDWPSLCVETAVAMTSRSVSSEGSSPSVIPSAHSESTTHKVHNRVEKGHTAPSQPGDYESSLSIPYSRPTRIRQRTTATRSPHNTLLERRVCDVRIHVDGRATLFFFLEQFTAALRSADAANGRSTTATHKLEVRCAESATFVAMRRTTAAFFSQVCRAWIRTSGPHQNSSSRCKQAMRMRQSLQTACR